MSLHKTICHQSNKLKWDKILTGRVLRTHVLEILEVLRQTSRAVPSRILSAHVLVYKRRGVHHEHGVSAKHHVLGKRTER